MFMRINTFASGFAGRESKTETERMDAGCADRRAGLIQELYSPAVSAQIDRELAGALIGRISVYENKRMEIVFRLCHF